MNQKQQFIISKDLKIKNNHKIPIVCDLCSFTSEMRYDEYKKKTKEEKHGSIHCKDCKEKLVKSKVKTKCIIEGCNDMFEVEKYYYEVQMLDVPGSCFKCRQHVIETCVYCHKKEKMKYHRWKKATENGTKKYICKDHDYDTVFKMCLNCGKGSQALVKNTIELRYKKYLCENCIEWHSKGSVKCQTKRCNNSAPWLDLY